MKYCACVLSCFSHVRLFATQWTIACQAPLSRGFSRHEYWNGLLCPPPGDLPNPEIEPVSLTSPALAHWHHLGSLHDLRTVVKFIESESTLVDATEWGCGGDSDTFPLPYLPPLCLAFGSCPVHCNMASAAPFITSISLAARH